MAVRIPKEFAIEASSVEILQRNGEIVIRPIPQNLATAFELLTSLPADFFADGRQDTPPQTRDY